MQRVTLGRSGLSVSPVAFGTWQLSPRFWGPVAADGVIDAVRFAFDSGINFFDTADAYGDGAGETILGEAIRTLPRQELVICSKVYNHFNSDGSRYPDLSAEHIIERCNASLGRLQIETLDLYLLHFYDVFTPLDEIAGALDKLRQQGKVLEIGVSNHSVEQLRAQRRFAPYNVVQPAWSFVEPLGETNLLPYCQSEEIGVMAYSPLHKGLLSGKYRGDETFNDFRSKHPDFQGERFRQLCDAVQAQRPLAEKYGLSLYQLFLAATLSHPGIDVAVCGFKDRGQVAEAIGAIGPRIERQDWHQLANAVGPGGHKVIDARGTRK